MNSNSKKFKFYSWLCDKVGVDFSQLHAILSARKILTSRTDVFGLGIETNKLRAYDFQLILFSIFGIPASVGLLFDSVVTGLTISYTIIMFAMSLTLISQFASVLLDTTDNQILLSKPINGKTLFTARLIYISRYMIISALTFSLSTLIFVGLKYGVIAVSLFIITLILLVLFLIVFVALCFVLALKKSDAKKVQNGILIVLIIMAAFFMLAINAPANSLINDLSFKLADFSGRWMYFYPPAWMAGLMAVYLEAANNTTILLAIMAVLLPIVCMLLAIYLFGNKFNKALASLASTVITKKQRNQKLSGLKINNFLINFLNSSKLEKAVYVLVTKFAKTDQSFKFRTYPIFGMLVAAIALFFTNNYAKEIPTSSNLIFFLHSLSFMSTSVTMLQYGDNHRAAWIYEVLPIDKPGLMLIAAVKVFIIKFILPLFVIVLVGASVFWGKTVLADIFFAGVVSVLMCILQCFRMKWTFPFAQDFTGQLSATKKFLDQFLIIIPLLLVIGLHLFLKISFGNVGVGLGTIVLVLITILSYHKLAQLNWENRRIKRVFD